MSKAKITTKVKVSYNENFRKQKTNKLKRDYDADCYILIRRSGQFYTYMSID